MDRIICSTVILSTTEHVQNFSVSEQNSDIRLDVYLSNHLPYSRSFCKQLISEKFVSINNTIATHPSKKLKMSDAITVRKPALGKTLQKKVTTQNLQKHPVTSLFEHDDFIILDKPAGMIVHNTLNDLTSISLVDWLKHHFPSHMKALTCLQRPGIVHRLDKQTSGIMIAIKTQSALDQFLHMFKGRLIHKTYLAVVKGHPPLSGTIDLPIGRNPIHRFKMAAFSQQIQVNEQMHCKSAITHYHTLDYFEDTALVQIKPVTGRTHQIRVHFAAIGHGLVGDVVYNKKSKLIKRHALHAHSLEFEYKNQAYSFSAPLPEDFQSLCEFFRAGNHCK